MENQCSDSSEVPEESSIESVSTLNSPTLPAFNNHPMNHEDSPDQQQARINNRKHCLQVIGPRHPTLITSNVDLIHILPYLRREKTFITTSTTVSRPYWLSLKCEDKDEWKNAIQRELLYMSKLKVWDIMDLRSDYKLVGTTWVFKLKRDHLHQTVEHKAGLCAQGFTQTLGVDFNKTYYPMGRLNSLRALIAHSCPNGLDSYQIDVKTQLHGCLIFWKTRKQPSGSISTAKAEYKSLCDLTSELLWFQQWYQEADILHFKSTITVWEDNQSCIKTANGKCNLNTKRMKHVEIQLHFVKEEIKNQLIELCYAPTSDMLADFLTKAVRMLTLQRALKARIKGGC
ncbi:hypothetical protein O181_018098 [Austropuccinia psidii MF-1]|uniref:Reverse transcriptase Ty1/copia-type domain-containing protein n=1 Tax=Austropuccinia psidii MF-1 TaxID=1389203 RepID=A0A9Q3C7B4_9BASI|nr:hypothetical protein [Austropuccinia psidii MF-1]